MCKYCDSKYTYYDQTSVVSPHHARVCVDAYNHKLAVTGDRPFGRCEIPIKYCPVCGRNLSENPIKQTEQSYFNIIRENIKQELQIPDKKPLPEAIEQLSTDSGISTKKLNAFLIEGDDCLTAGEIGVIAETLKVPVDRFFAPFPVGLTYSEGVHRNIADEHPNYTKEEDKRKTDSQLEKMISIK